ncbi:hypothetical protein Rhopal_006342-T1 [Rhodotorula paludigena]|uniref:Nucleotide-diphospho-sugar transferase domain-containing protein n=1 Tax=Rhodotorula paludigena TaxID=86838 RepID=A0AAV5GTQ5_9BASI|nr:hypothetical protein Rhopal_006342-T1 [Rhodotorula paludigena]
MLLTQRRLGSALRRSLRLSAKFAFISSTTVFLLHLAGSPWVQPESWSETSLSSTWRPFARHDIALIFDENRVDYAAQLVRSAAFAGVATAARFHLVAPPGTRPLLQPVLDELGVSVEWYDYGICEQLVAPVRPFANEAIHTSALCKLFLADILKSVDRVLYFKPWEGLVCGNVPKHHRPAVFAADDAVCSPAGQPEPAQVNGGVILMELARMRRAGFADKLLRSIASTFVLADRRRATWAEQEFLNSYIRDYPDDFSLLPCGCNYQYVGLRREVKSTNAARETGNPYNQLFHHFRRNESGLPPTVSLVSDSSAYSPPGAVDIMVGFDCVGQSYPCSDPPSTPHWGDPVYVLTRTAERPRFFAAAQESVRAQTYPYIKHLIVSNDASSMAYLHGADAELAAISAGDFDPDEVCRRCDDLNEPENKCGQAPKLGKPNRQRYLECYCSTNYPMNELVNNLLRRVERVGEPGWIIILDDDNVFNSTTAVSDLMLDAAHPDQLLLFQSILGRPTPSPGAMNQPYVVRGDIDASNFMFHSSHIADALWDGRRCGDWRAIDRLANMLDIKWSTAIPISAHPQRAKLGGMGGRHDLPDRDSAANELRFR